MTEPVARQEIEEVMELISKAYTKLLILIDRYEAAQTAEHGIDQQLWTSTVSGHSHGEDMGAPC